VPTLEEIAKISKVSRSTVSRVINHDPHVADETREKVMSVVKRLNYQPNAIARSLAAGRTRIVGLIVPAGIATTFHDPFFPAFTQAMATTCAQHDYSVMLWLAEPDYERRMIQQVLNNGMLDGVIISSIHLPEDVVQALMTSKMPFVVVGQHNYGHTDYSYIDVENRRGAQEAVTHLLRLGHRRIAHIAGPQDTVCAQDRLQGYKDALRTRGLALTPELVVEGDFTEETGYYVMKGLLPQRPDALFAANDLAALGAMRALTEAGYRIPEDMPVVGFDDVPAAASTDPPLTTVRQPTERMGVVATETLIDMLEHGDSFPRRVILPTEFVIRASCGAEVRA
jgi:LacI family transcriptional regulator